MGLSLPGVPGLVAGSNGRLAWGFTNAYGDFAQWVALPEAAVVRRRERFALRGGAWHEELLEDSPFGPVLARLPDGTPLALAWTAHRPGAADLGLFALLEAGAIEEALTIAAQAGMPAQNLLLAAADGRIAWGIAGRLPERLGPPAALLAHDDPRARWRGWIEPARQPRRVDPAGGRLWSANARMVAGEDGERIGDGGLVLGARARQIRDALLARERLDERGALTIQLDDRALFLQRWREVLLTSLDALEHPLAGEARRRVAQEAERAAADAVGYRLLREFRLEVHRRVAAAIVAAVRRHDPAFEALELPHFEGAVWRLLEARPAHWLGPHDRDWDGLLAAAATAVLDRAAVARGGLEGWTWGERNRALIRHPLSLGMPWLGRWLDAPADPLPGDLHMPRVQGPVFGASQRLAVRPGRETSGLLHMPGGQSGHPRSPFYLAGHEDWARGRPAPLLPGAARHRLELSPEPKASAALPWAGRPAGEAADARPRTR
ncbi:MAG: penicillin acylase family protein [Xanthomonadales bacterium]|nr:penicillin acylase family protein [Xanthomonadales bacterium]